MRSSFRFASFAAFFLMLVSGIGCSGRSSPSWIDLQEWENDLFDQINSDRQIVELHSLERNDALDRVAGEFAFLLLRDRTDGSSLTELLDENGVTAYVLAGQLLVTFESPSNEMPRLALEALNEADEDLLENEDINSAGIALRFENGIYSSVFIGAMLIDTLDDGGLKPFVSKKLWSVERLEKFEAIHFERLNDVRKENELGELQLDRQLSAMARVYAEKMLQEGFFGHNDPSGKGFISRVGETNLKRYNAWGENLASLLNPKDPALDAMTDLMNSPGHRANILRSTFTHVGIGAATDGRWWMFVQTFGTIK